jgi:hypothetical protein
MYEAVKSDNNTIVMVPSSISDAFNAAAFSTALNSVQKKVDDNAC